MWNKGKYRPVILTDQLRKRLLYYIRKNRIQKGNVFITRSGHEKDRSNIWRELKQLAVSAGWKPKKFFRIISDICLQEFFTELLEICCSLRIFWDTAVSR